MYYFNEDTDETTWDRPENPEAIEEAAAKAKEEAAKAKEEAERRADRLAALEEAAALDAEAEEEEEARAADAEVAAAAPSGAEPSEAGSPVLSAEALAAVPAAVKDRLRAALQSAMLGDLLEAARESLKVWQWVSKP